MGDIGDYWREAKEAKRRAKESKQPCLCCGRNLDPGEKCFRCGFQDERKEKGR